MPRISIEEILKIAREERVTLKEMAKRYGISHAYLLRLWKNWEMRENTSTPKHHIIAGSKRAEEHKEAYQSRPGSDDCGRKMAEYANKYLAEFQSHPTSHDLWVYMQNHAAACGMKQDPVTGRWTIQDRIINERGFKSRLKDYRN